MIREKQDHPFTVQFGIVDGCNQNCEFCGMQGRVNQIHYAESEVVDRIIEMLCKTGFVGRIRLDLYGEPTLHPDFIDIVKKVHTKLPNSHVTLFTNGFGVYHKNQTVDEYFAAGVGDIIFDVYENTVHQFTDSHIADHPLTCVNSVGTPFFVKEKRILVNLPIENQQDIKTRKFVNHCGAGAPALTDSLCARCAHPFRDFTVNSWGEIMLCCNDFRGEYLVGSIFEFNNFEEAWNSPRLQSARKRLYAKDRGFNPCNKCNSKSHRVGLLPDKKGKKTMENPTDYDKQVTEYCYSSKYIKSKRREWEQNEHCN